MTRFSVSGVLQIVALFFASWIAIMTGNMQPAGALGTVAVLFTFIYSRFHTLGYGKLDDYGFWQYQLYFD